jgi:gamma-glutamyltranspeptidase/glutathione hydrolase
LVEEGQRLIQLDLGSMIAQLRIKGPGEMYNGVMGHQIVDAFKAAGGTMSMDALRDYAPSWRGTVSVPFGHQTVYTTTPPITGGITTAAIWTLLTDGDRYVDADSEVRAHLMAEAAMRGFLGRGHWLGAEHTGEAPPSRTIDQARLSASMASYDPQRHTSATTLGSTAMEPVDNPPATGFVTVDSSGTAVVCIMTMNELFGTGRVAPGTGVVPAAAPREPARGLGSLAPIVIVNHNTSQVFFAAGATGGAAAPSALATVMREAILQERSLDDSVDAPRLHHSGEPDEVVLESALGESVAADLRRRGHATVSVQKLGRVNAVYCPGGLPRSPETCLMKSDRRGYGLATGGMF